MSPSDSPRWGFVAALILAAVFADPASLPAQVIGKVTVGTEVFEASPTGVDLARVEAGLLFDGGFQHVWDRGRQSLGVEPFVRLDPAGVRTRLDFQELSWGVVGRRWELRAGVRELFWGVAESRNVIDVVNQRDLVVGREGFVKMGQPMLEVVTRQSWGRLQFLLMPFFRERTFAGRAGQLWSPLPVAAEQAVFTSSAGRHHVDAALRWEHTLGAWDLGLGYFRGTNREPEFLSGRDERGHAVWVPRYDVVDLLGIDVHATAGSWLWKLEGATLDPAGRRYVAAVGGFEYAFADYLSGFAEYLYDSRGDDATTSFGDDFFLGIRLLLLEGQVEGGATVDRATGASSLSLSLVQRLSDSFTVNLNGGVFLGDASLEPPQARREHTYLALSSTFHF